MLEERQRKEVEVESGERRHMEKNTKGDMEKKVKKKDVKKSKRKVKGCKRKR